MCRPVACKTCQKITWAGCGMHIEQVRAGIPAENWCPGRHPKAESEPKAGWLRRVLNR